MSRFGVFPVEVRLLGAKEMQIVFLGMFIPLPHTTCKVADPVVGSFALAVDITSWSPDVPVSLGVVFR